MIETINGAPVVTCFEINGSRHKACTDKDGNVYLPFIYTKTADGYYFDYEVMYLKIPKELKVIDSE